MIVTLRQGGDPAENTRILQQALDKGGTIRIEEPGTYDLSGHLTIGDNTSLEFGANVFIRRAGEITGPMPPFLYNKGLETDTFNHDIRIEGLHLITNGVDMLKGMLYPGLRGHVAFVGIRNLTVSGYEVHDLNTCGYGIQVVHFENILLENLFIEGLKDGVHLGRGSKFTIRHAKFRTFDDPVAFNAYDYSCSNYQYGWIEDGLVEDCYDLNDKDTTGFFCRLLGGSWRDWYDGMRVQNSTMAVHNGRLYTAIFIPLVLRDNPIYSHVPPTHEKGVEKAGGVVWRMAQEHDGNYQTGCRRITFRDIFLQKTRRVAFSFEFCTDEWADSLPDGAPVPVQEDIVFDGIYSCPEVQTLLRMDAPCKNIRFSNCTIDGDVVDCHPAKGREAEYFPTDLTFTGTVFKRSAALLKGNYTKYVSIQLNGCSQPEGCTLTYEGEAKVDGGKLNVKRA